MTEVDYYFRIQEVVLNSGVDDAMDLAAFCNKKLSNHHLIIFKNKILTFKNEWRASAC